MKRRCKIFQERTASGGAGLIQDNICDDPVIQPDSFHILPANVQDKSSVLYIFSRGPRVSYGLYYMAFCLESLGKKQFPVAGSPGGDDIQLYPFFLIFFSHGDKGFLRHQKRIPFIWRIERIQDIFLLVHENKLCGSASRVNAKIGVKGLSFPELGRFYLRKLMSLFKFSALLWGSKKRSPFLSYRKFFLMFDLSQPVFQFLDLIDLFLIMKHSIQRKSRSVGNDDLRPFRTDDLIF